MANPIATYMEAENIGTSELATRLGISKPYASQLKSGGRAISVEVATRLGKLTGRPWHEFIPVPEDAPTPSEAVA